MKKSTCLTKQFVEVSVFARYSDDHCVQPPLGPPLQTFQSVAIHFLWGLELLHNAPHVTSPEEKEQRI